MDDFWEFHSDSSENVIFFFYKIKSLHNLHADKLLIVGEEDMRDISAANFDC